MYIKRLSYSVTNYLNLFDNLYNYFIQYPYTVLLRDCGTAGLRKEFYLSRNNKFFSFSNTIHQQNLVSNLSEANDNNFNSDSIEIYGTGSFTACLNNSFTSSSYYGNQIKFGDETTEKLGVACSLPKVADSQIDIELYSDKNNYNFILIFNFFIETKKYTQYIAFGDMFNGSFNDKEGGYVIGTRRLSSAQSMNIPKDYNMLQNFNRSSSAIPFINCNENFYYENNIISNIKLKNGNYLTRQNIYVDGFLSSNVDFYNSYLDRNFIGNNNILSLCNEKNGLYFLQNLELNSVYEYSTQIDSYCFIKQFNFGICNNAILFETPYRKVNDKYFRVFKTCHSDKNNFRSIYHKGLAFFIEITKEEYEANI